MKILIKNTSLIVMLLLAFGNAYGQKKAIHLSFNKPLPFSADKIWDFIAEDYGSIANAHPRIIVSNYLKGSLKGGEGVERVCNFNEKGTQYLKEKMVDYNPDSKSFTNQVFQAGKFPVDPSVSKGVYNIIPISENSCKLVIEMYYRTKPAFMGGMMKGSFRKLMEDYFIGIEHFLTTGEKVTKENFKDIKKKYK